MNAMNYVDDKMTVKDYENLYSQICALSHDCDGFGLFDEIGEEEIQKCKWLKLIFETLNDVPKSRLKHVRHFTNPKNKAELDAIVKRLHR